MGATVTDPWLELSHNGGAAVYEKELLPVGKIVRWVDNAKDVLHANIKRDFLDRLVSNFKQFKENGIRVPVFKSHNEDPANKRGQVEDIYVKPNSQGLDSLHAKVSFDDPEAVKLGRNNDVSVLIPPKFVDGRGRAYDWPLRHVAITATPVVPGLDDWSGPMVFAFEDASVTGRGVTIVDDGKGGLDVDAILNSLGQELSLEYPDGASTAEKLQLALEAVQEMKSDGRLSLSFDDAAEAALADAAAMADGSQGPAVELAFPPILMKHLRTARSSILDGLVLDTTLSPAMGEEFKNKFCSEAALRLDLSLDDEETEFDRTLALVKRVAKDRPIANSGRKTIKLSHGDEKSPLRADAERRAEMAKQRRA